MSKVLAIESHLHLETGAIIATAAHDKLYYMINYIQDSLVPRPVLVHAKLICRRGGS